MISFPTLLELRSSPLPCPANNKILNKKKTVRTGVFIGHGRSVLNQFGASSIGSEKNMVRTEMFVGQCICWTPRGGTRLQQTELALPLGQINDIVWPHLTHQMGGGGGQG